MATRMNTRPVPVTPEEDAAFTETYRVCRNAGCDHQQRRDEFCCPACWSRLPGYLRDAVWRTQRERGFGSDAAQQAREDATAWLEGRAPVRTGRRAS